MKRDKLTATIRALVREYLNNRTDATSFACRLAKDHCVLPLIAGESHYLAVTATGRGVLCSIRDGAAVQHAVSKCGRHL